MTHEADSIGSGTTFSKLKANLRKFHGRIIRYCDSVVVLVKGKISPESWKLPLNAES